MFLKLFSKTEPDDSGSVDVLMACMDEISEGLKSAFERQYGWGIEESAKQFESLVLSKFLMDHALVSTFCDQISKKRLKNLLTILDTIFEMKLKKLAPEVSPDSFSMKFREYSAMLMQNPAPKCWQLIAGHCLGIDLVEETPTAEKFPNFLPELFIKAREKFKEIIR